MDRMAIENYGTSMVRPDDFDAFWDGVLNNVDRTPLNASVVRSSLRSTPAVDVFEVHFDSIDGVRIAGWYCLPSNPTGALPAILHVPGYIGEPRLPKQETEGGFAVFSVAPRGKLRSDGQFNPGYPGLLTHNIVDRNTYSYRGF